MVGVTGKLYLKHDGQSGLYEIKTNFDKGGIYENYNVLKFDPFTKVGAPEAEVTVEVTEIKEYVIPALSLFEMYESRLGDGEKSTPVVNLFDKNSANGYFVGNGSNGWANQSTYAEIYPTASFAPKFSKVGHEIPDAFANAIRWENISNDPNEEIWALIFDNTYNMSLQEVVEIPITLTVDYLWAPAKEEDRTATVTVKFINPELK